MNSYDQKSCVPKTHPATNFGIFVLNYYWAIFLFYFKNNPFLIKGLNYIWDNKENIFFIYCIIASLFCLFYNLINYIIFKFFYVNKNLKIKPFKPSFLYKWILTVIDMSQEKEVKNLIYQFKIHIFLYLIFFIYL